MYQLTGIGIDFVQILLGALTQVADDQLFRPKHNVWLLGAAGGGAPFLNLAALTTKDLPQPHPVMKRKHTGLDPDPKSDRCILEGNFYVPSCNCDNCNLQLHI